MTDSVREESLEKALKVKDYDVVRAIANCGVDLTRPLIHASSTNDVKGIRLLIELGAREFGKALAHAASNGHTTATDLLADLAKKDSPGALGKALFGAIGNARINPETVEVLVRHIGNLAGIKDEKGNTPLAALASAWTHNAKTGDVLKVARIFLDNGDDPRACDDYGVSVLDKVKEKTSGNENSSPPVGSARRKEYEEFRALIENAASKLPPLPHRTFKEKVWVPEFSVHG